MILFLFKNSVFAQDNKLMVDNLFHIDQMNSHDENFALYFKPREKAILARGENSNYINDFPRGRTGLWHSRLVDQQTQFWSSRYTNFTGGSFVAMRADVIPVRYDPYKVYENISTRYFCQRNQ